MENNEYLNKNIEGLISSAQPHLKMPAETKARVLSKLISGRAGKTNIKWRTILKSRITGTAVAAAVIIVTFVGMSYWPGSVASASTALAAVKKAMTKMPCVHILIKGSRGQKNYRREIWISFESETKYEKFSDGTISSVAAKTRKKLVYNPDSGKITVSYYRADDEAIGKMDSSDKLLSGFLEGFDMWNARVTVEERQYEGVDVYHAKLPETKLASGAEMTGTMELVVDNASHLPVSAKLSGRGTDGTLLLEGTLTFDYPENDITDIHALGVPEAAEVVSNMPDAQTDIVLDRLDRRVKSGFGNVVALLTESTVNDDHSLSRRGLRLFGRSGSNLLCARYAPGAISVQNWPQPDINEVLSQAENVRPAFFFVSNGTEAWIGNKRISDMYKIKLYARQYTLSGQVWPIPYNLGLNRVDVEEKATLLSNEERPEEVGLNFDITISERVSAGRDIGRTETTYWIDPARNDIITKKTERFYKPDRRSIALRQNTHYLDYAQTGSGQWYPTRWQMTISDENSIRVVIEYNLKIYSKMVLDNWWFTDMANGFEIQPSTQP